MLLKNFALSKFKLVVSVCIINIKVVVLQIHDIDQGKAELKTIIRDSAYKELSIDSLGAGVHDC